MATLKEMFDMWACEVLELLKSLLKPKVSTEEEQILQKITERDFKMDLKLPIYKKEMEILDLQKQLDDHLKIKEDIQIMYQKYNMVYPFKLKYEICWNHFIEITCGLE